MKALKIILVSVLIFNLFSCRTNCCTNIFANVDVKVLDAQGKNLLADPAVYTKSNTEIYNVINGHAQINLGNVNRPLFLESQDGKVRSIRVFLHFDKNEKTSLTLIKFGDTKTDTIAAEFKYSGSSVLLQKVWVNGVEKPLSFAFIK